MEYIGIVWLTSWMMEFFSSHKNLLTTWEYLDQSSEANVLLVANDSESLTSVESQKSWMEPLLHSLQARQSANPEFCRPPEEITTQTQLSSFLPVVAATSSSQSVQQVSQRSKKHDSTPTMLEWMENILPLPAMGQSKTIGSFPAVQVVRVDETNSDTESAESMYQIWVKGCLIGKMPHPISAYAIALQLQHLLQNPNFDPRQLKAKIIDGQPGVEAGSQLLFLVDPKLAEQLDRHPKTIAVQWVNNLRQALDTPPLTFADTGSRLFFEPN